VSTATSAIHGLLPKRTESHNPDRFSCNVGTLFIGVRRVARRTGGWRLRRLRIRESRTCHTVKFCDGSSGPVSLPGVAGIGGCGLQNHNSDGGGVLKLTELQFRKTGLRAATRYFQRGRLIPRASVRMPGARSDQAARRNFAAASSCRANPKLRLKSGHEDREEKSSIWHLKSVLRAQGTLSLPDDSDTASNTRAITHIVLASARARFRNGANVNTQAKNLTAKTAQRISIASAPRQRFWLVRSRASVGRTSGRATSHNWSERT